MGQASGATRSDEQGRPAQRQSAEAGDAVSLVSKVATVSVTFWILKVIVTTVGDLSGDALSISLGLGYRMALLVVVAVFAALLLVQLNTRRFVPGLYWLLILGSSAVGAEVSDSMDRALHWGNLAGTGALLGGLAAALAAWRLARGAVRFAPIRGRAEEGWYWLAAVLAGSCGSAFGDLVGGGLGWGLLGGIAVNLGILAALLVMWRWTRLSRGVMFWIAFVVSRVPF